MMILLYLLAIVLANLSTARWGPGVSVVNAFLLVGLDLTARDRLHDSWSGRWLWPKMALLIVAGSVLSWLLNRDAGRVALASMMAFAVAGAVDALIYALADGRPRLVRINGSNVASAAADSLIFPWLAFGGLLPLLVVGQFVAKVGGGFVWSLILLRWEKGSINADCAG